MRPRLLAAIVALTTAAPVGLRLTSGSAATPAAGAAECHAGWPVTAHHAGGQRVTASGLPVACAVPTGYATSETSVAVSNDGALFFSPAQTENTMARSADGGTTWGLSRPPVEQLTALWNTVDPVTVVDRSTGRIFWVHATGGTRTTPILVSMSPLPPPIPMIIAYAYGFQVYSTGDDGRTWTTADYTTAPTGDWEKIAVGRPSAAGPQPAGYPNVVYVCANSPFEVSGPGRICYRSLDGGASFAIAGYVLSPQATSVCPPLDSNTQVIGPDGTLYIPMSCVNGAYVAVSKDEGATYTWYPVPGAPSASSVTGTGLLQLAIDDAGTLYGTWGVNDTLQLAVSRDQGVTWGAPVNPAAPAVHGIALPAIAAGPAGHVALTYYANPDASATTLDGYITQTDEASAANPLFVSGMVNDPAHPIYVPSGLAGGTPRADYIGGGFDVRGQFWAGMVRTLGVAPASNADVPTTGYVARLVPASAAAAAAGSAGGSQAGGLSNTAASTLGAGGSALGLMGAAGLMALGRRRRGLEHPS